MISESDILECFQHLVDSSYHKDSILLGSGDDAAVIDFNKKNTLISTDMLVEGVHFDLSYFPLKHLGYKAITSSISDICAMNGICSQVTVSVAISNRFKIESLKDLYSGIKVACENYNIDLVNISKIITSFIFNCCSLSFW